MVSGKYACELIIDYVERYKRIVHLVYIFKVLEAKTKKGNPPVRTKSSSIKIQKSDMIKMKRNSKQLVDQRLDSPFLKFQTVIDANSGVEVIIIIIIIRDMFFESLKFIFTLNRLFKTEEENRR